MEPKDLFRLFRRRWLLLYVFLSLGAAAGYASTLVGEEETGPVVDYWAAAEVLVLNPDAEGALDFQRTAVFAVAGDIPDAIAAERGMAPEELISRIRTVSDRTEGTLTISAIDTSPEGARDIAEQVSQALLARLEAEGRAGYDEQVRLAEELAEERLEATTELDIQIEAVRISLRAVPDDGTDPAAASLEAEKEAEIRSLTVQRDAALGLYNQASEDLRALERIGPPAVALVPLDRIPPFRISAREYNSRRAQGRQGQNNFSVGEVDLADTSRPTVSERLESPVARAVLGAIAALVLGMMAIAVHYRLDPRLHSRDKIEAAFGLPVLASVPVFSKKERKEGMLHARDKPQSAVAEAYRYLRSVLLFARSGMTAAPRTGDEGTSSPASANGEHPDREVRVVMVTSAGEGEGKSTTSANLAVLLAEAGYETILINCDFRLPSVHTLLDLPYSTGVIAPTGVPKLRFVADVQRTEGDTPGQVSERQRALIRQAREMADVVVLDTAPLLATNDAIDVLLETDLVVLVAREGKTTAAAAAEARELVLDRIGVPVAGVVVTAAGAGIDGSYYERYRYGNYFQSDAPDSLLVEAKRLLRRQPKAVGKYALVEGEEAPGSFPIPAFTGTASDVPLHAEGAPAAPIERTEPEYAAVSVGVDAGGSAGASRAATSNGARVSVPAHAATIDLGDMAGAVGDAEGDAAGQVDLPEPAIEEEIDLAGAAVEEEIDLTHELVDIDEAFHDMRLDRRPRGRSQRRS